MQREKHRAGAGSQAGLRHPKRRETECGERSRRDEETTASEAYTAVRCLRVGEIYVRRA